MKVAIITITDDAQGLAFKLADHLENDSTVISVNIFHKNVKDALQVSFESYDCIICIMATGIVVRNICSLIKHKLEDPAVIVIDDLGKHVISLISGHFGRANAITLKIADIIDADPVITTSTDLHNKMGIDAIAAKYFLHIHEPWKIKVINSALLHDKTPDLYIPERFDFIFDNHMIRDSFNEYRSLNNDLKVIFEDNELILKPKKIVVGIGSRKGISTSKIYKAIEKSIYQLGLPLERIDAISTANIKKDEEGIIKTALKLNLPLKIVPIEKIKNLDDPQCSRSEYVMEKFGVFGISEPVALITAGKGSKLIFRKTAFNGVTVAVAVSSNSSMG